jgi:hypothetical protein
MGMRAHDITEEYAWRIMTVLFLSPFDDHAKLRSRIDYRSGAEASAVRRSVYDVSAVGKRAQFSGRGEGDKGCRIPGSTMEDP